MSYSNDVWRGAYSELAERFDRLQKEFEANRIELERHKPAPTLQDNVKEWCVECFGETTANDVIERNWRFLEEALELVQSLGGSKDDALKLVDYVYDREIGDPPQEVGGVMITLSALCAARGIDWHTQALKEFQRINQPDVIEKIRAKHVNKPHRAELPTDFKYAKYPEPGPHTLPTPGYVQPSTYMSCVSKATPPFTEEEFINRCRSICKCTGTIGIHCDCTSIGNTASQQLWHEYNIRENK